MLEAGSCQGCGDVGTGAGGEPAWDEVGRSSLMDIAEAAVAAAAAADPHPKPEAHVEAMPEMHISLAVLECSEDEHCEQQTPSPTCKRPAIFDLSTRTKHLLSGDLTEEAIYPTAARTLDVMGHAYAAVHGLTTLSMLAMR